jgi:hypothetical protein
VLIHDADFTDSITCAFWLEPNTPLQSFTMRGYAAEAWGSAMISFYVSTADGVGWVLLDNASLRVRPALTVTGTECYPPGATVPSTATSERAPEMVAPTAPEVPLTHVGIEPTPFAPPAPFTGAEEGQTGEGQLTEEGLGG